MQVHFLNAYIDEKNTITIYSLNESSFTINDDSLNAMYSTKQDQFHIYKAYFEFDLNKTYIIKDNFGNSCKLYVRYYVKNDEFDQECYYGKNDLGPTYSKEKTTFKLWAPIASKVILSIKETKEDEDFKEYEMKKTGSVFAITIQKDLKDAIYNYKVTNNDKELTTLDPYSYSSNANSNQSAVIDLTRIETKKNYAIKKVKSITDCVLYEMSIRDFSMDEHFKDDVKGTFKAVTISNLKSTEGHPIGVEHLKQLGITHVQLMPILDFATVNEENIKERYNWGYDPFCYNALEGSYSTNPHDPYCRMKEAKEMIDYLHKNNIGVVLDVVFNHTYFFDNSIYNKIVPYYYYLMDKNGNLSNGSYCGNDIDCTRKMVRKYLIDMCTRLVSLYKIDGLRFDLMGILSKDLIMEIYRKCRQINPSFILYGEGWNMPSMLNENLRANTEHANEIPEISFFNDYFRDIVSGRSFNNMSYKLGYLNGDISLYYLFTKAMRGSIENDCYFHNPSSSINYVECHDNYTLFDKIQISNANNTDHEKNKIRLCCLAATILAQGVPFLHLGCEFNRSKKGVENSYNSSDYINKIIWDDVDKYQKNIKAVKDFLDIKKNYKCFNMNDRKSILSCIDGQIYNDFNVLVLTYAYNGNVMLVIFNPTKQINTIPLNGDFKLIANVYGYVNDDNSYNQITIKPYSMLILKR